MIYRQLPAFSPVSGRKLLQALLRVATHEDTPGRELAKHLRQSYDAERVILTGSGTEALQLAFLALRERMGADIIIALPAYSCFDLITAAVGAEVSVTFYDVDPISLAPDLASLAGAIQKDVAAVVVGNLFGFPIDWDGIRAICRGAGAVMIEDAAQGLGSAWRGASSGSLGDVSVMSFGRGKGWSGGSGGALLIRGELVGDIDFDAAAGGLRSGLGVRSWLTSLATWAVGRPSLYRIPTMMPALALGETRYKDPGPVRAMPEVAAAIGFEHALDAAEAVDVRRGWAKRWRTLLGEITTWTQCRPMHQGECGYLRYPVLLGSGSERAQVLSQLNDAGAAAGYPVVLPDLPAAELVRAEMRLAALPGAHRLAETLITLPTHPRVTERDLALVRRVGGTAP